MEFPGQRNKEQFVEKIEKEDSREKFLIKSKQSVIHKVFTFVFSIAMWCYIFIVFNFFISACLYHNSYFMRLLKISFKISNNDIRRFLAMTFIIFLIFFVSLLSWKYYNKARFGKLNRRSRPGDTTDKEICDLKLVDAITYERLKKEKVVIFEKNPIKEIELPS
ncbi:MAG: poly-beta-1,6-N-acetyl-D-glucosamine biosynthesis protein PgaD [Parabacteroides sp.]|nr:poly-beta-1,6-N-acetyl-D-glucosamine biosynthesis protein PgaD [Parabacteroides sp.]